MDRMRNNYLGFSLGRISTGFPSLVVIMLMAAAPVDAEPELGLLHGAAPLPAHEIVSLSLAFREDCWTEIRDGTGKVIIQELVAHGRRLRIEGRAPFHLLLGDAQGVDLVFDGAPVPLPRKKRPWATRMTLERSDTGTLLADDHHAGQRWLAASPRDDEATNSTPTENLELRFRDACWTEVRDGAGNILVQALGTNGRRFHVEGIPPFALVLGNASNVDMLLNGQPVTLGKPSKVIKRFTLHQRAVAAKPADFRAGEVSAKPEDAGGSEPLIEPLAVEPPMLALRDRARDPERWFDNIPSEDDSVTDAAVGDSESVPEAADYPRLVGASNLLLEYNSRFSAEERENEFDDWMSFIDSNVVYHFNPRWVLSADIRAVLEGEDDGLHRFDSDFPEEGLYVKELRAQRETQRHAVFGGKYDPVGSIFGYAPTFFGNYAADFNLEERIGVGASLFLQREASRGTRLSAHVFFLDESALSGELFSGRARDGTVSTQVGDTGKLNNFLVTLDGGAAGSQPGLRYTLGAGRQVSEWPGVADEKALLGSLFTLTPLSDDANLELSLDLLSLENAGGSTDDTESFTFGAAYSNWPMLLGASYSARGTDPGDHTDRIVEFVFRAGFTDALGIELGYQHVDEGGEEEESIGAVLMYGVDWQRP